MSARDAAPSGNAVASRLAAVRDRIAAAAARAGRRAEEITLVGVSKRKGAEQIVAAVAAGLDDVGENYVQEALAKWPDVCAGLEARGLAPPRLHFVGQLQRNKARQVAPLCDVVQTLDRVALGEALDRRARDAGRTLDVLVQVDLSDEPRKGGAAPDALPSLLDAAGRWPSLRVRGLMAIPAPADDPEAMRPAFARLRALRDAHGLPELSMGMSADFEVAIEEGATIIRVGTAIFGARDRPEARGTGEAQKDPEEVG